MKFIIKVIFCIILWQNSLFANNYLSGSTCSSTSYHILKNELNLDDAYSYVGSYSAEAFVSYHIYDIDKTRDVGEEFQFGKDHIAKLLKYTIDVASGFEAALYEIDNERLIIAFGGTTSQERYSQSSTAKDIYADSILLSEKTTSYQVNAAAIFLQKIQVDYPDRDIIATGHSLGGGLAQFASLMSEQYSSYKKIKAVTFNTAPMPLTNLTKKWIQNLNPNLLWAELNNINFMANNDPLTNLLKSAEKHNGTQYYLKDFIVDTGIEDLNIFLNYIPLGQKIKMVVFNVAQVYMNQTVRDLKKLIYGKRIVLDTDTGHSMLSLLKVIAPSYASYGTFRHGFSDIKVTASGLYCDILNLMKKHVVSYPKQDRDYKFYPNNNASRYEISLFIINSFYYQEYRVALEKAPNLSKFDYFNSKFQNVEGMSTGVGKDDHMTIDTFSGVMGKIYQPNISELIYPKLIDTSSEAYKQYVKNLNRSLSILDNLILQQFINSVYVTRAQMVSFISDSLNINYHKITQRAINEVKDENKIKTGPKPLRYYSPLKFNFMNDYSGEY